MPVVVDLIIRKKEEIVLADVNEQDISLGDRVLVEIEKALEVGHVTNNPRMVEKSKQPIYKILRKVSPEDEKRMIENRNKLAEVTRIVSRKIEEQELDMKLTGVEYTLDRMKLFIYYTSETRIDFRHFIKDLGHILRTHIQMVQIGVRDETRILGGFGHCGRVLCCCSFLKEFAPITVGMAKEQNINFNIAKLSGLCGRLMCCLAYENKFYVEMNKTMPEPGAKVHTPDGEGTVTGINHLTAQVTVKIRETETTKKFHANQVTVSLFNKITKQVTHVTKKIEDIKVKEQPKEKKP
jgi:cell fate regulator YaaT (PSP1 superfamily)